jgi:outer membrane lipoprotein SlyB
MKTTPWLIFVAGAAAAFSAGCQTGTIYDRQQVNAPLSARPGVVERVQPVTVEGRATTIGRLGGAAIGSAAAQEVGKGTGNDLARVGAAIGGAVAGEQVETVARRRPGQELEVRLDDGNLIVVIQEGHERLQVGDRVRVLSGRGTARVTRE